MHSSGFYSEWNKFLSLFLFHSFFLSIVPAVAIDKKRCSFRRETWRLSCSDVWVIRHERCNNLDATRNLEALTWRRLNYGRPAIRYVTYLPATIDYAENTRLSPPRLARLDFRLDRGENLRALLGYLYTYSRAASLLNRRRIGDWYRTKTFCTVCAGPVLSISLDLLKIIM